MRTYYDLLGLQPSADADEVKRAFRREIARYHPDKVQHLGPEFQEIAASRAAELTEAYRILMDAEARQSYDAMLTSGAGATQAPHVPPAGENRAAPAPPPAAATPPLHRAPEPPGGPVPESLRQTQRTLSQFVKKATLGRIQEAIGTLFGAAEPMTVAGFDAAYTLRARRGLFQKADPPVKLFLCVVSRVDAETVDETWPRALKAGGGDPLVCLLLLGLQLAPARELAMAIAEHRRRSRQVGPVVIPVDTREWDPLIPPETPNAVRKLLERLKLGT